MTANDTNQFLPLTPVQEGMVFEHLSAGQHRGLNIEQLVCDLRHAVEEHQLLDSFRELASSHPELRVAIDLEADTPQQVVHSQIEIDWQCLDWSDNQSSADELEIRFAEFLQEDRIAGLDIAVAPMFRVRLIRFADDWYRCVWTLHHMLLDGRSFGLALSDVFEAYDRRMGKQSKPVPSRPAAAAYYHWQATLDHRDSITYWRDRLEDVSTGTTLRPAQVNEVSSEDPQTLEIETQFSNAETDRLHTWCVEAGVTVNSMVQAAWALLHHRYSGNETVVIGAARAGRAGTVDRAAEMLGVFITTVPVRVDFSGQSVLQLVQNVRQQHLDVRVHEHVPLADVLATSAVAGGTPLFESLVVFDHQSLNDTIHAVHPDWENRHFDFTEKTPFPFTLYGFAEPVLRLKLAYDEQRLSPAGAAAVLGHLRTLILGMLEKPDEPVAELPLLTEKEQLRLLRSLNATESAAKLETIPAQFQRQAAKTPDAICIVSGERSVSYSELATRAQQVARLLAHQGVVAGQIVGVSLERSVDMLAAILGAMRIGAAYLPLDPDYPAERTAYCLQNSGAPVLLTTRELAARFDVGAIKVLCLDDSQELASQESIPSSDAVSVDGLAYVIYTSGSTGNPKGVMLSHANVANFFNGMDDVIQAGERKTWLAVTSLSFDISVLELLWTLTRGFKVVIAGSNECEDANDSRPNGMQFSLFYFASDPGGVGRQKYQLVLEGAKFADRHGFEAIWTPERHFHSFGGLYPNPSVIGAAVAACTRNIGIRAGSVVLPLHHPLRVVEEWSLVDNLCNGRVGLSFASGWQPNDFVLAPQNYETRREDLYPSIETVRSLWRGDAMSLENPKGDMVEVRPHPRPVQAELPVWVTAAGSPDTFRQAGEIGANLLTHLLGQSMDEVREKIAVYRQAREEAGFDPTTGRVTLMLHTFVGEDNDAVREQVREPMKAYLKSAASLVAQYADAWTAYKQGDNTRGTGASEFKDLSPEDMDGLVEFAFERYFETSALFGTPEKCGELVDSANAIGVDEIACLIDFGVDAEAVLASLQHLNTVKSNAQRRASARAYSISELINKHAVSHLQCTPSTARSLLDEDGHDQALGQLEEFLIGGEAFPEDLWLALRDKVSGGVINMYGPTETTIWSTCSALAVDRPDVTIGKPIANTRCYVLDGQRRLLPEGVPGELYIGGAGVARGYHNREDLTAERFLPDPFAEDGGRMYRTGDIARWNERGELEFLGRADHQVKIRGYRIELGEIESHLGSYEGLAQSVVVAHQDSSGASQLIAYCVCSEGQQVAAQSLIAYLRDRLPDYMVPSQVLFIDKFPLTPNRKIDRGRLPSPESLYAARLRDESRQPVSATETRVKEVWEAVLGLENVGINDNFFEIGGHSLRAVQVQSKLRAVFDRRFPITDIFRFPTVESFAAYVDGDQPTTNGKAEDRAARRRAARSRSGRRGRKSSLESR